MNLPKIIQHRGSSITTIRRMSTTIIRSITTAQYEMARPNQDQAQRFHQATYMINPSYTATRRLNNNLECNKLARNGTIMIPRVRLIQLDMIITITIHSQFHSSSAK